MPVPIDSFRYRTFFIKTTATAKRQQGEFWIANETLTYEKPGTNFLDDLGYDGWELVNAFELAGGFLLLSFKQPFRITT